MTKSDWAQRTAARCAIAAMLAAAIVLAATTASATASAKLGLWTQANVNEHEEKAVKYLDENQNLNGSYGTSAPIAETGMALVAYSALASGNWNNLPTVPRNYRAHVELAITWLLGQQQAASGKWADLGFYDTYSTGIALGGLGSIEKLSNLPVAVATALPIPISKGRKFLKQEFQGAGYEPLACPIANPAMLCDGWNYDPAKHRSDESNTGYALFGLHETGGVPPGIASQDLKWQRRVQELSSNPLATRNDGGANYQPLAGSYFSSNANDSGSMLFGSAYDGALATEAPVQAAILFDEEVLNEYELEEAKREMMYHDGATIETTCSVGAGCHWHFAPAGEGGYHYSLFSITKGLGLYQPTSLTNPSNWWAKLVDLAITQQAANGSWPQNGRDDNSVILATAFTAASLGKAGIPNTTWLSNGTPIPAGTTEPVATHGSLKLTAEGGEIEIACALTDKENVTNHEGGGLATDEMTEFTLSGCQQLRAVVCQPGETLEVNPGKLPWQTTLLTEADEISGMELRVECNKGGVKTLFADLTGTLRPRFPVNATFFEFTSSTGELQNIGGELGKLPFNVTGTDKLTGPPGDEKVTWSGEPLKKEKVIEPNWKNWNECLESADACLYVTTLKTATLQLGNLTLGLPKPIKMQTGVNEHYVENPETGEVEGGDEGLTETFEGARTATKTLPKVGQPAPSLEQLIEPAALSEAERATYEADVKAGQTKVTASVVLAGTASSVGLNESSLTNSEGAGLTLPVKITWSNPFLGKTCAIGTTAEPILLHLTTGTTVPPEGVEPVTGDLEEALIEDGGAALVFTGGKLVDNTYATPAASGCGKSGGADAAMDAKLALPSAPGTDAALIGVTLGQAPSEEVKAHGF
jgi:hypothetical protein